MPGRATATRLHRATHARPLQPSPRSAWAGRTTDLADLEARNPPSPTSDRARRVGDPAQRCGSRPAARRRRGARGCVVPVGVRAVGQGQDVAVAGGEGVDRCLVHAPGMPATVDHHAQAGHPGGYAPGHLVQHQCAPGAPPRETGLARTSLRIRPSRTFERVPLSPVTEGDWRSYSDRARSADMVGCLVAEVAASTPRRIGDLGAVTSATEPPVSTCGASRPASAGTAAAA
jgi:hypothetical protein